MTLWLAASATGMLGVHLIATDPSRAALAVFLVLLLGPGALAAADAWRVARSTAASNRARWRSHWNAFVAIVAVAWIVILPSVTQQITGARLEPYRLTATSMSPTYRSGDYLFVLPLRSEPRRGDVVVYRTEYGKFVHRIVAVEGDTVAMQDATLLLNGRAVRESYAASTGADLRDDYFNWQRNYLVPGDKRISYKPSLHVWGPLIVPRGKYLVLGDNRDHSADSRYLGFVSRDSIVAQPLMVYFSWDSTLHAVRWNRVGIAGRSLVLQSQ